MLSGSSLLNSVSGMPTAASVGAVPNPFDGGNFGNGQNVVVAYPQSGSNGFSILGLNVTTSGTASTSDPVNGSVTSTRYRRVVWTSSGSAGSPAGIFTGHVRYFRGSTGGFQARFAFGQHSADTTGYRAFVGLAAQNTVLAGNPSALLNMIGLGFDDSDAAGSTWFVMNNNGSGAAVRTAATGVTRNNTSTYELVIDMPVGDTANATVSVFNFVTGALIYSTVITSELPVAGTLMAVKMEIQNGAIATACAIQSPRFMITSDNQ